MTPEAINAELHRLRAQMAQQESINAELMRGIQIVQQAQVVLGQHVELLARRLLELAGQMTALEVRIGATDALPHVDVGRRH